MVCNIAYGLQTVENTRFVYAPYDYSDQLGEISDTSTIFFNHENGQRLSSYMRISATEYYNWFYEYVDGIFVMVEENHYFAEIQDDVLFWVKQVSKPIDGEMKIVDETREKVEE